MPDGLDVDPVALAVFSKKQKEKHGFDPIFPLTLASLLRASSSDPVSQPSMANEGKGITLQT